MSDLTRQGGGGGVAGETITPPSRAVLGIRFTQLIIGLALSIVLAYGDPSDSGPTVGTLAGTVHDGETDAPLEVADGWITFGRLDVSSTQQIWRRSPDGEEAQVSAFGEPSTIEVMGPDGEVVFTSDATGTVRRYRARVGESPEDVSTGLGKPVYSDGQLHLMMGATLLDVD